MALNYRLIKFFPLTVYRKNQGSYVNGLWVEGTETNFTVNVKIQPLKDTELMILPEALRNRAWVKLYVQAGSPSTPVLRCAQQGTGGYGADFFVWQGYRYEVMKESNYQDSVLEHTRVLAARVEITPN